MHSTLTDIFISPQTHQPLLWNEQRKIFSNDQEEFRSKDDVYLFLEHPSQEYEGAYLNKIKYIPRRDVFPFTIPLWMMASGYVWEVRRQLPPGALICELGCASGVNYFGQRYNMVGVDYSFQSLKAIENYTWKIQANAIALPFKDGSLDGIISSFFWEHILPSDKEIMLKEFYRVLRPGGKVVMLYDVVTQNRLIRKLKDTDPVTYESLFLRSDYHIGYETLNENREKFTKAGFTVLKHFGMERTYWTGNSVYTKLSTIPTFYGKVCKWMMRLTNNRWIGYLHMLVVRLIDVTLGRWFNENKSRIAISVLIK